ncbi:MAG: CBS domain-containing protein [Firmicutes bacterium]|jgi:CBS domain-containing protein|nr:CBS domain-containing protein [Bacillota bacterium]
MLVKDLMSASISYVFQDDTIKRVIFIMKSEDVGILPVCDKQNHVLGVITDRDIVVRNDNAKLASEIMTENVVTVNSGDDIHQAALKFSKYGIHRLPVIDNQRLVGMLSLKDLAKKKVLTAEIGHIIYNIYNHK